jgi:cytochrome c peroxidase
VSGSVCRLLRALLFLLLVCCDTSEPRGVVELGRRLFFDPRLSLDNSLSCASCHQPERAFTDGLTVARGLHGIALPRNTPSLANLSELRFYTWANPKLTTLAAQALVPLLARSPRELGVADAMDEVRARLATDVDTRRRFQAAFPRDREPISTANIVAALAAFERTLSSRNAPYDRYLRGETRALGASALRGKQLFESKKLACASCHTGVLLTDAASEEPSPYHNTGLYNLDGHGQVPRDNQGLFEFTHRPLDLGKFRTPSLRNVALTAPYMHDGSLSTLDDVIDHYAAGGRTLDTGPYRGVGADSPLKDARLTGFSLSPAERSDLLMFLASLTDPQFVQNATRSNPFARPTRISKH